MSSIDDLFAEDSDGTLVTPLPDDETLEEIESAESYVNNAIPDSHDQSTPQSGVPGTTVECEICGKRAKVKRDGMLGAHGKCEPRAQRGNRLEKLPDRKSPIKSRTRDFAVGVLSWGIEEATANALARPFDADPREVPTELPDADVMVGVPLDMLWPEIPKAAQAFIDKLADNSDVIECGMAWFEWMRTVGQWTREQRMMNRQIQEVNTNGAQVSTGTPGNGTVLPFIPAEG